MELSVLWAGPVQTADFTVHSRSGIKGSLWHLATARVKLPVVAEDTALTSVLPLQRSAYRNEDLTARTEGITANSTTIFITRL